LFQFFNRALMTLEGISIQVNPTFNFMEVARPYARDFLFRRETAHLRKQVWAGLRGGSIRKFQLGEARAACQTRLAALGRTEHLRAHSIGGSRQSDRIDCRNDRDKILAHEIFSRGSCQSCQPSLASCTSLPN